MSAEKEKPDFAELGRRIRDGIIHSHRMSHGNVVASAAAILDQMLEQAIMTKLPSLDKRLSKNLFEDFRPLGSFAAKIDLAHALGITSDFIYAEIQKIRKIRNEFAHSVKILSLDVEPMKSLFLDLKRPANVSGNYEEQFMACIVVIDEYFEAYMVRMGVEREQPER
jgi:hypothetical protein